MNAPENAPTVGASQLQPVIQSRFRTVYCASALAGLAVIPDESVQVCVTSPPYWGLRNYNIIGQFGLEKTPEEYVEKLVSVFQEVRRVLRKDATLWINLGDSYASGWSCNRINAIGNGAPLLGERVNKRSSGMKEKDLVGIPWLVALALRADGWYLRSDIIWSKPNPMPSSVRDRPTSSHEYLFLLSKSRKYYYDSDAIAEPCSESSNERYQQDIDAQEGSHRGNGGLKTNGTMKAVGGPRSDKQRGHVRRHNGFNEKWDSMSHQEQCSGMRNKRSVWTVAPASYREAHFATFPPKLIEPCIMAGSKVGDTVLDPFAGSGTTGQVAINNHRKALLIELNPDYIPLINRRTSIELQPELEMV